MSPALDGVERLPLISVLSYEEEDGTRCYFPIDPCDSIVEALRMARFEAPGAIAQGAAPAPGEAFVGRHFQSFGRGTGEVGAV